VRRNGLVLRAAIKIKTAAGQMARRWLVHYKGTHVRLGSCTTEVVGLSFGFMIASPEERTSGRPSPVASSDA